MMTRKFLRLLVTLITTAPFLVFISPAKADYCDVSTTTYEGRTVVIYKVSTSTQTCYAKWIAPAGVTAVDIFAVAGGGSGGTRQLNASNQILGGGGGGGAGGLKIESNLTVSPGTSYALQVGIGGASQTTANSQGNNGVDTGFHTVNAVGGGGGGAYSSLTRSIRSGKGGGSGGGAGRSDVGDAGSATSGQGNIGGSASGGSWIAGGGGGAGGAGGNAANSNSAGAGGAGVTSSVTGTSVTYAGGGGGSGYGSIAVAGTGACSTNGGAVEATSNAGNGPAHTGCGGGGGGLVSGAGGSGILVITYVNKSCAPTSTYSSGNVTLKFTDTFLCSWQVPANVSTVSVEVVGGGGGGGFDSGGGGGGGGYGYSANYPVTANSLITVSVGQGGDGGISTRKYGIDGYASTFGGITANGGTGGAGCTYDGTNCQSTNAGGNGGTSSGATTNTTGKTGGNGYCYQSSGSCSVAAGAAVTGTTSSLDNSIIYGTSGGGNDSSTIAANIGKGGGGGDADGVNGSGRAGGSGVVVVKFAASTCSPTTTTSGEYKIESFTTTSSCKWQVPSGVTAIELLVVGGGGGGGYDGGGGGGGGGVIYKSSLSVTAGDFYNVVVGAGGAAGSSGVITTNSLIGSSGLNGDASRFGSVTAIGGGGGGGRLTFGLAGASGGGAGHAGSNAGGAGSYASDGDSTTFGNSGGATGGAYQGGSGGGGANAAGANSAATSSGAGGAGYTSSITGSSVIYGGGGGGGIYSTTTSSATGCVTGGRGGTSTTAATAGTANTGCGGGGGGEASRSPAAGGSGIVIIRYLDLPTVSNVTISGTAKVGQILTGAATVTGGGTTAYQWQVSDTSSGVYTDIAGATSTTFTLTSSQLGKFIKFKVTQTNASGSATTLSSATSSVYLYDAPTLSSVAISGTAFSGSIITATPSASGEGTITYSYQWSRLIPGAGTSQISGATSNTYTLTDADLLGYVFVSVVASNESGSSSAVIGSMPSTPLTGVATPTVSGVLQSGQILTGATTSSIPAGMTTTYQWLRADSASGSYSNISGATSSTYQLTSADVGKFIKFQITIRNLNIGASDPSISIATSVVNALYTITYSAGTGGSGSAPSSPTTVANGATFTTPANPYTRDGYSFAGWSDGTNTYAAAATYPVSGTVSGNVTLTATWSANTYTVTFSAGSFGTGSVQTLTKTHGVNLTLPNSASANSYFTRSGFTVTGWSVADNGSQTHALGGSLTYNGVITLYAVWTGNALTPTFGTPTSTGDGFTVAITNYNASYTWSATATASGSVSISNGLITVTGVAAATSSTVTVTTTRIGFSSASAAVTASSITNFAITYSAGTGGSGSAPSSPTTVANGATFTTPANPYTRDGYSFAGWSDGTNTYAAAATYPVSGTVSGNVTLTATWSASTLNITYNANGGGSPTGGSATTTTGGTISSLPTTTRSGYTFNGWFTAASGGTQITTSSAHNQTANFTLYAQWSIRNITITYNGNGSTSGSVPNPQSIQAAIGRATISDKGTLAKSGGYIFDCWNTSADLSGDEYCPNETASFNGDITLYAIWASIKTITYNGNGNTDGTAPNETTGLAGATLTIENQGSLTKTGYTFIGWNTQANGGGTTYLAGGDYNAQNSLTIYAQWSANTLTITYDSQGGSAISAGSTTTGGAIALFPGTPTRSGYTFTGWFAASTGGSAITFPYTHNQTANFTLYAQWITTSTENVITFTLIENQSYGASINLSSYVSASSGLTVSLSSSTSSVCTISTSTVTAIGLGTCTITASQAGNATYSAASNVSRSFTVGKKSLVITIGNISATVGSAAADPTYTQTGLVTALGDSISAPTYKYQGKGGTYFPSSTTKPSKLGSYQIGAQSISLSSGLISNYEITVVSGELTISGVSTNQVGGISIKRSSGDKSSELLSGFSDSTTTYTIFLEADVSAVIATITRPSGSLISAQIKVNNSGWRKLTFTNNSANSGNLPIPVATNTISILTTATDQTSRSFTITIFRDTKSAPSGGTTAAPLPSASPTPAAQAVSAVKFYVNNLSESNPGPAEVPLSSVFRTSDLSYSASFTNKQSATTMQINFTAAGINLRLKVNNGPFRVIPAAGSSNTIALNVGSNTAILRVFSTDGTTVDYTFTLTRAAATP